MTSKSKNPDKELDQYLDGNSEISRHYASASNEEVPEHLDEAILAVSREKSKSGSTFIGSPFATDWKTPLSLAAVLVLSVTIFINMKNTVEDEDNFTAVPGTLSPDVEKSVTEFSGKTVSPDKMRRENDFVTERQIIEVAEPESRTEFENVDDLVRNKRGFAYPAGSADVTPSPGYRMPGRLEQIPVTTMDAPEKEANSKKKSVDAIEESLGRFSSEGFVRPDSAELPGESTADYEQEKDSELRNNQPYSRPPGKPIVRLSIADSQVTTIDNWLGKIKELWLDGDIERAKREYQQFRKEHPGVTIDTLRDALGKEIQQDLEK